MVIFDVRVPVLYIEYLNKRTIWEAKIFGVFLAHLGLHTGNVSLKSVTSIEHVGRHFGRLYHAMAPMDGQKIQYIGQNSWLIIHRPEFF